MTALGTFIDGAQKTMVSITKSPPMEVVQNIGALA